MDVPNVAGLIDTHCHLDHARFDGDAEGVIARAVAAGVERLVTIGCADSLENVGDALAIAERFPERVRATVGVHPHDASSLDEALMARLETLAEHPLVVAIGETGLDFHYDHSPRELQREAFRWQIALAKRVCKPLVIHTRNAAEDTLSILKEESARDAGGIIHCFSETPAFARGALDMAFVSSFSGLVTFPRGADDIRLAAAQQPADAILVETDAPFLAPVPFRGKRNEPAYVAATASAVATLRGQDVAELAAQTTANAERLLGRW